MALKVNKKEVQFRKCRLVAFSYHLSFGKLFHLVDIIKWCTDNLCIEKVSHYWLTLLVICMATYMPNFGLVR